MHLFAEFETQKNHTFFELFPVWGLVLILPYSYIGACIQWKNRIRSVVVLLIWFPDSNFVRVCRISKFPGFVLPAGARLDRMPIFRARAPKKRIKSGLRGRAGLRSR